MGLPFEPLETCSLLYLSWKVAFLVTITSVRRVSELKSFTSDPPYTIFYKDKVQLWLHPAFLPKVISQFHANQDIFLPVIFSEPQANCWEQMLHSLYIRWALTFYIKQTKPFCKLNQLFVAVTDKMKGLQLSSQRISSWITSCVRAYHDLVKIPSPVLMHILLEHRPPWRHSWPRSQFWRSVERRCGPQSTLLLLIMPLPCMPGMMQHSAEWCFNQ